MRRNYWTTQCHIAFGVYGLTISTTIPKRDKLSMLTWEQRSSTFELSLWSPSSLPLSHHLYLCHRSLFADILVRKVPPSTCDNKSARKTNPISRTTAIKTVEYQLPILSPLSDRKQYRFVKLLRRDELLSFDKDTLEAVFTFACHDLLSAGWNLNTRYWQKWFHYTSWRPAIGWYIIYECCILWSFSLTATRGVRPGFYAKDLIFHP